MLPPILGLPIWLTMILRTAIRAFFSVQFVSFIGIGVLVSVSALGCISEDDLTIDQRAYQLSQQLMCPVCDGQTLDQSQAQISLDMQAVIREKLEGGETNQEIRSYFVQRYGEVVLAAPGSSGFNLVAWAVPMLIFGGGVLVVINALHKMRSGSSAAVEADTEEAPSVVETPHKNDDLAEYLERVDAQIAALMDQPSKSHDEVGT